MISEQSAKARGVRAKAHGAEPGAECFQLVMRKSCKQRSMHHFKLKEEKAEQEEEGGGWSFCGKTTVASALSANWGVGGGGGKWVTCADDHEPGT